jgi:hypothetical protein
MSNGKSKSAVTTTSKNRCNRVTVVAQVTGYAIGLGTRKWTWSNAKESGSLLQTSRKPNAQSRNFIAEILPSFTRLMQVASNVCG